jgi:ATP-binding cassette subfamily C protein LapB
MSGNMTAVSTVIINDAIAVDAICDMAQRRGLHAARTEVEQTWKTVAGDSFEEKLCAAWTWLFTGHTLERLALGLARTAQLPAWILHDNHIGVVTRLAADGEPMQVTWINGEAENVPAVATVLLPMPPDATAYQPFVEAKKRGAATEAIITALKDHRGLFVRVGLVSLLMNLLSIVSSLFTMQVYDRVVPNFAFATLWVLASGVLLAYLFELAFKLIRLQLLEASTVRLDEGLSLYFVERLLALKLDRRPSRVGSLVAQVRDYESIKNFFTSTTLFTIADLPFIALFIAVIAMIGGPVAWVLVFFVPVSFAAGIAVYKPTARLQALDDDDSARRTGVLFEAVAGAEGVKAQGGEPRFSDIWLRATRESTMIGSQLRKLTSYAQFGAALLQNLSYIAVIIVGVYVIKEGHLTMGGLIACSILSGRVLNATSQITRLLLQWHHARHSLEVLDNVLSCPSDDEPSRQAHTHTAPLDYAIKNLKYSYGAEGPLQLEIGSLRIGAGERIAVMGRNGSGKSTLLRLLAGLGTPNEGQVLIAGLDIQQCRPGWLREVIGYLPQEVRLFSGTLAENLTIGMSMPGEAAIRAAMEKTGLIHTLGRHPLGLALPISEGGSGLSGGQRQMVGLTRMVLQNPKIWLLDEPSSSLDAESERRLIELLRSLPKDRTIIFTSHRQHWLSLCDRMLLIEDGAIKADAPADQVRTRRMNAVADAPAQPLPSAAGKS